MYQCDECKCLFETPNRFSEDCTPGGAFEGMLQYYSVCPYCGSSSWDEYCGKYDEENQELEEEE